MGTTRNILRQSADMSKGILNKSLVGLIELSPHQVPKSTNTDAMLEEHMGKVEGVRKDQRAEWHLKPKWQPIEPEIPGSKDEQTCLKNMDRSHMDFRCFKCPRFSKLNLSMHMSN